MTKGRGEAPLAPASLPNRATADSAALVRDLGLTVVALALLLAYVVAMIILPVSDGWASSDAMAGLPGSAATFVTTAAAWWIARRGRPDIGAWMLAIALTGVNLVLAATLRSYVIFVPLLPVIGVAIIAPHVGLRSLGRFAVAALLFAVLAAAVSGRVAGPPLGADWTGWAIGTGICDLLAMLFIVRAEARRRALLAAAELANAELRTTVSELEGSRASWQTLVEATPTPLWAYDPATLRFVLVNKAAVDVYGWSREAFLAGSMDMLRAPGQEREIAEMLDREHDDAPARGRVRHVRRDGSEIEVQVEDRMITYEGAPVRIQVLADVTELVRLKDERARLLDQSADFILTLDRAGRVCEASRALLALVVPGDGELLGTEALLFVRPEDREVFAGAFVAALGDVPTAEVEAGVLDRNQEVVEVSWRLVGDPAGGLVWAFGRDVTAARGLEEQLHRSERMRVVGQLAGGVAHDFNNLLTAIAGHAELALDELPPGSPVRADLETISATATRAGTLTRQLLAFGRQVRNEPRYTSFDEIVDGVAPLLQRLIGEHIHVQIRHGERVPILADPGGLDQVLLNLVVNARDAMPEGGSVTIETDAIVVPDASGRAVEHGLLRVSDTGTGMSPGVLARIFEPFYTTKPVGSGVGLGLSSADGFVGMAGGRIEVASEVGVGSSFQVLIPAATEPVPAGDGLSGAGTPDPVTTAAPGDSPEAQGAIHDDASSGGRQGAGAPAATILLVEDEDGVRTLARRLLERAGYTVLEAADGETAERIASETDRIDLLLTDIVMPGFSGRDLASRLLPGRPDLRVILMSGYERGSADATDVPNATFIGKPWSAAALLELVTATLELAPVSRPGNE